MTMLLSLPKWGHRHTRRRWALCLQRGEQYSPSLRLGVNGWPHVAQGRLVGCPYRFARYRAFSTLLRQSGEQAMIDRPYRRANRARLTTGRLQLSHGSARRYRPAAETQPLWRSSSHFRHT